MGLITIDTKWDDISEYVLLDQDNNVYSLSIQANLTLKSELMKAYGFNNQIWNFKYSINDNGLIGLQFLNNDDFFTSSGIIVKDINISLLTQFEDSPTLNILMKAQIDSYYRSVKWDKLSRNLDGYTYGQHTNSDVTISNINNNFETEVKNKMLTQDPTIRNNFIHGNANNYLYVAAINPLKLGELDIVSNYYRILKKKNKQAYLKDFVILKGKDPNFVFKLFTNQLDKTYLNDYCCNDMLAPECSPLYYNKSVIGNNLYYAVYNGVISDYNIIKTGYVSNPIANNHTIFNDITPLIIDNQMAKMNGIMIGSMVIPTTEEYTIKIEFTKPVEISINDNIVVSLASQSPIYYKNIGSTYNLKILIEDSTNIIMSYKKINMDAFVIIPSEWFFAPYYYDVMKDYNEYLVQACTPNWNQTNCYNAIKSNNYVLDKLSNDIITSCKQDATKIECKQLFNNESINFDIKKAFCMQDNNFINSQTCNDIARENKNEFKQAQINYCTNDKKSWDDATCQDYIMNWYPNDNSFYDAYCLDKQHFIDDYKTCSQYYGTDITLAKGNQFVKKVNEICTADDNLFKTCISSSDIVPEYLNTELKKAKYNYCNIDSTFTDTNCMDLIKSDPTGYDELLIKRCNSYPSDYEPCKTILSPNYNKLESIPTFNKQLLTTRCIDKNGLFTPTAECENRNTLGNAHILNESIGKYCSTGDNISTEFCKTQMQNNIFNLLSQETNNKSGFVSDNISTSYDYTIFIFLLFILLILVIVILKNKLQSDCNFDTIK